MLRVFIKVNLPKTNFNLLFWLSFSRELPSLHWVAVLQILNSRMYADWFILKCKTPQHPPQMKKWEIWGRLGQILSVIKVRWYVHRSHLSSILVCIWNFLFFWKNRSTCVQGDLRTEWFLHLTFSMGENHKDAMHKEIYVTFHFPWKWMLTPRITLKVHQIKPLLLPCLTVKHNLCDCNSS